MRIRVYELAYRRRKWTMRRVAEALGVEHQTVLYWNQGRCHPRLPMMIRLCRLLRCKLDELVELSPREAE